MTAPGSASGWRGSLELHYRSVGGRTVPHDRHEGPLRVLQPLYPEGPAICHHVLVHPPGGVVGGDQLLLDAQLDAGAHALITTPGATRFYRSESQTAVQTVRLRLEPGARLEWLPMETIAYPGCEASSSLVAHLRPGAQAIGWDVLALGLPAAGQAFDHGRYVQHIEVPGVWLERGAIDGADALLLRSPLGFHGHAVLATLWFVAGDAVPEPQRDALLEAARDLITSHTLARTAGATAPQSRVVVLRALARGVEPAMQLLAQVRAAWRAIAWDLPAQPPRIWRT